MSTLAEELRALASDERATSKFSVLVHLAADIHEMETDLARSSARIEELQSKLEEQRLLVRLWMAGWDVIAVSLYDEEGIEGWRWNSPHGTESEVVGDWSDGPIPSDAARAALRAEVTG